LILRALFSLVGSIGAIKLRGTTLATGSLDGTLRIWNVRTSACLKIVKMPAPVSSLDFYGQYGPTGVIAAGGPFLPSPPSPRAVQVLNLGFFGVVFV
jgi:WD40 repeat protein